MTIVWNWLRGVVGRLQAWIPLATTLVLQAHSSLLNLIITWFLVRQLGVAGFGYYAVYFLVAVNVSTVALALIVQPLNSLTGQLTEKRRDQFIQSAHLGLISMFGVIFVASLFVSVGALLFGGIWLHIAVTMIYSAAMTLGEYHRRILFLRRTPTLVLVYDAIRSALLPVALLLTIRVPSAANAAGFTVAIALTYLLPLCLLRGVPGRIANLYGNRARSLAQLRRLVRSGRWLAGAAILQFAQIQVVILLSFFVLGASEAGLIRLALTIVGLSNPAIHAMEHVIPAQIGRRIRKDGWTAGMNALKQISAVALLAFILFYAMLVVVSPYVLDFMDVRVDEQTVWLIVGLCFVYILQVAIRLVAFRNRAFEATRQISDSLLLSAVASLLLAFPSLTIFGVLGVPLCLVATQLIALWLLWCKSRTL